MMTLEEVWESLKQDPETKATMEEAEKSYKLFKKIENLIVSDLEAKLAKGVEIIDEWMQLNFEKSVKINELEHQLEDKEKIITEQKIRIRALNEENFLLKDDIQMAIKTQNKHDIEKNQTAIDKLEKVKEKLNKYNKEHCFLSTEIDTCEKAVEFIEQQIKELKGEK